MEEGAITPPHTQKEGSYGVQPWAGCGRPSNSTLAAPEGPRQRWLGVGEGFVVRPADAQ